MIKRLNTFLNKKHKVAFFIVFLSMFLTASLEMLGIGVLTSIVIFLKDPDNLNLLIQKYEILSFINFEIINFNQIFIAVIIIFFAKGVIILILNYFEALIYRNLNTTNTKRLFNLLMRSSYSFHTNNSSSKLTNDLLGEINRTNIFLLSIISFTRDTIFFIFIITVSFYVDFKSTLYVLISLGGLALVFFVFIKKNLKKRGSDIIDLQKKSLNMVTESVSGIKYIKIASLEDRITNILGNLVDTRNRHNAFKTVISKSPKYFLELIAVVLMMLITSIYLSSGKNFSDILPILTFYVLAALRMIPVINSINISFTNFKYCEKSFINITNYFLNEQTLTKVKKINRHSDSQVAILTENLSFNYDADKSVLKKINIKIPFQKKIGIIGNSGSGKTTLIDLMMQFLYPSDGSISYNKFLDRSKIGYIGQQSFFLNDSLANNISFDYQKEKIDIKKMQDALETSYLGDYVKTLEKGIETNLGDKAVKMSNGQKQRLALARIFYNNFNFVVLDEATNALEENLEQKIFNKIYDKSDLTAIIVTHNIEILKEQTSSTFRKRFYKTYGNS